MKKSPLQTVIEHELIHLIVSIIFAALFWIISQNMLVALVSFALSMFLDADHLVDYGLYLITRRKMFSFREFLSGTYFPEWKKFIAPGHSWEIVVLSFCIYYLSHAFIFLAIAVSLTAHYILDYCMNDVNTKAYFFLFRLSQGFQKIKIKGNKNH